MTSILRSLIALASAAACLAHAQVAFDPPAFLNFGSVPAGQSANAMACTLRNTGGTPTTINSIAGDANRFFYRGDIATCRVGVTLPAGGTCLLAESFFPDAPGAYSGLATVTTTTGSASCGLQGTATAPQASNVSVTPLALNFGNVTVGTTSPSQSFTVRNNGTSAVSYSAFVNGSPPFTKVTNCTPTLNPGDTCSGTVTFSPTSTGAANGSVQISAGSQNFTVVLSGIGATSGGGPAGSLTLTPSSINFGQVQVGASSGVQVAMLFNGTPTAATPVTISVPVGFTQTNTCGASLAAGASCQVLLRFVPQSLGLGTGTLRVVAGTSTLTATLSGIGASSGGTSPSGVLSEVFPRTVLAATSTPTSALVTYRFAANTAGVNALDAVFCTQLVGGMPPLGATSTNPCSPGSEIARYRTQQRAFQVTQNGPFVSEARESMVVPLPVVQQAYQHARAGGNAVFYFVRRFEPESYAVVEVRLAGNSAAMPINLYDVRLGFAGPAGGEQPVAFVHRGEALPPLKATLFYTGAGLLRGTWEIVEPGQVEPEEFDLLPGANISAGDRARQRRYTVIERFEQYLPATGRFDIVVPDTRRFLTRTDGAYRVILRIEPELAITTGGDIALAGGGAVFPMPTLRYFVGSQRSIAPTLHVRPLAVQGPAAGDVYRDGALPRFAWQAFAGARYFRVEIADESGAIVYSAMERAGSRRYEPPAALRSLAGSGIVRWRIVALSPELDVIGASAWTEFRFQ